MILGLLRHGIAEESAASDFDRAITEAGARELARVAAAIVGLGFSPDVVLHSPLRRTRETAEIVAPWFPLAPVTALDALALGNLNAILTGCARWSRPLLVGHEPTMGVLCARLLGTATHTTPFRRGGFALLEVDALPPTSPATLLAFQPPSVG